MDDPAPPFGIEVRLCPGRIQQCEAPLCFRLRRNQVRKRLRLDKVHLPIEKCPPREFARFRLPQTIDPAQRVQYRRDHRAAAMEMKFGTVLARETGRAGKEDRQALVQHLPSRVLYGAKPRNARRRHRPVSVESDIPVCRPDSRITATPAGRRPLDSAKIVSWNFICPCLPSALLSTWSS